RFENAVSIYHEGSQKNIADWERLDDAEISQRIREHYQEQTGNYGDGGTRFHDYADLGGEDYHELLLKLPERSSRDYVRPSENVAAKYKDEWDRLTEQLEAARGKLSNMKAGPERDVVNAEFTRISDQMD